MSVADEKLVLANEGGGCYKMTSRGTAIFVHYVLMTIAKKLGNSN